nr:proteasome subunit beta type-2-A [Ipomoea batatas]
MVGNGFALVVADTSAVHSILVHKSNEDKIMILDSHKLMGASGEAGDRVQFTEYIQKNVALYQFRNGIPLTTAAAANFTRGELATALRKNPYSVNILLAGYDKQTGPSLYYIDYIASLHKVDKGAFGYGSYFSLAMMDRHYRKDMTVEEAIDLADKCIMEIRSRLVIAPPNFVIKIVDQNGAREQKNINEVMAFLAGKLASSMFPYNTRNQPVHFGHERRASPPDFLYIKVSEPREVIRQVELRKYASGLCSLLGSRAYTRSKRANRHFLTFLSATGTARKCFIATAGKHSFRYFIFPGNLKNLRTKARDKEEMRGRIKRPQRR